MANSGTVGLDAGNTQRLVQTKDSCYLEETDDNNLLEDEELSVSNVHQSESDSSKSSEENERDKESFQPRDKRRSNMTAKNLDIGDLFNTSMFQKMKMLEMAKMLHNMKDAIALTEENVDLDTGSKGTGSSNKDKRKKKDLFRK